MADINPPTGTGGTIDLRTQDGQAAKGGQTGAGAQQTQTGAAAAGQNPQGDDLFNKFEIPESVREKYADLIPLVLETESMNDDERQYWFQILPIMTDDQVLKLREILANEKKQLAQLDKDYQQEVKKINSKHVSEWKAFEAKEKREKLKVAEGAHEVEEKASEEDLLTKLQQL